jgi:hypothetical protein
LEVEVDDDSKFDATSSELDKSIVDDDDEDEEGFEDDLVEALDKDSIIEGPALLLALIIDDEDEDEDDEADSFANVESSASEAFPLAAWAAYASLMRCMLRCDASSWSTIGIG